VSQHYSFNNLFYEVTRRCNLACPQCMAGSADPQRVAESVERELSVDEIERHVLGTASEIGIETITWSGGEFIFREDHLDILRRATRHGYSSIVTTNATLMTREKLLELQEASGGTLVVAVGINSIEDENAWTRQDSHVDSLRVLDWCEELGILRNVVVTVGKHNLETLAATLQWLEDRNIPYNRSPFVPRNCGDAFRQQLCFDRKEMEEVIHPALRAHPNGYISYTPFFLSPEVHERHSKGVRNVTVPQNPSIGCWCGTWLGLSAEGDVSPCGVLIDELRCGNVREKSFQRIIDESEDFQRVLDRDQLQGKCGRCRYQYTCGGCRALAWYHHGDLMAEDPTCFFEPEDATTVCEHEEQTNRMFRRYAFMVRHAHSKRSLAGKNEETRRPEEKSGGAEG